MTRQLLPFTTGMLTLVAMWLAGSKHVAAWVVGLANQALWVAFVVVFEAWGLLPLTIALTVIYTRNLLRWLSDPAVAPPGPVPQRRFGERWLRSYYLRRWSRQYPKASPPVGPPHRSE